MVSTAELIGKKLSSGIPRNLLLALERLIPAATANAWSAGQTFREGHRATAFGNIRHLRLNEAFEDAFEECDIPRQPLRGNAVLYGTLGAIKIARVHQGNVKWDNGRRSKRKLELCAANGHLKRFVAPDLFKREVDIDQPFEMAVFVVTESTPLSPLVRIFIVVTDDKMNLRHPLFREELNHFLQRYQEAQIVKDIALPTLKPGVKKILGDTDDGSEDVETP